MTSYWQPITIAIQYLKTLYLKTPYLKTRCLKKYLKVTLAYLLGTGLGLSAQGTTETFEHVQILSLSSTMDQSQPPIDFQTTQRLHHCGGKGSNHYRLYTRHGETHRQRLSLLLMALTHDLKVTLRPKGCEGPRMLVDWIKISRP